MGRARDDIGRLIVPEIRADRPGAFDEAIALARPVAEGGIGPGGFLVFGGAADSLGAELARVREAAGRPLLFYSDLERGAGQQVKGLTRLPHLMALGAADDEDLCRRAGALTAREARAVGIHIAFTPVVDLATEPANPIMNTRAFGDDPERVGALGAAFVRGLQDERVLGCAKHYPGHGETALDSHDTLPSLDVDRDTLERRELVPFGHLSRAAVGTVMTGHLAVPALTGAPIGEPLPVTLSKAAIDHLRGALGYDGLVVTDALMMGGIVAHYDESEAGLLALQAGCDVLLDPADPRRLLARLQAALAAGEVEPAQVERALTRLDHAIAQTDAASPAVTAPAQPDPEGKAIAREMAERAIARFGGPEAAPLGARVRVFVVSGDAGEPLAPFVHALRGDGERDVVASVVLPDTPDLAAQLAEAVAALADGEVPVVIALASRPRMSKGTAGLPAPLDAFAESIVSLARDARVVAFGSPWLLDPARRAGSTGPLWVTFSDVAATQRAAARALIRGGTPAGTIPLTERPPAPAPTATPRGS